ncbi:MAG: proline dehydrogenase family protein [Myxococcota bacterium]
MATSTVPPPAKGTPASPQQEEAVRKLGRELFDLMKGETPGIFDKGFWTGKVMDWAMKDERFKVDMFRFVDVLPSLRSSESLSEHINEYFLHGQSEMPAVMSWGLSAAGGGGLTAKLAAGAIKKNITQMAEQFIVGTDGKDALKELKKLHKAGMAFTVDLLGEAAVSQKESLEYLHRYEELVETLAKEVPGWNAEPAVDEGVDGEKCPRVNVSLKISALDSQIDGNDPDGSTERLFQRVLPLFKRARELGVFINLDMEQFSLHEVTYRLFERLCLDPALKDYPHLGVVVQAYLRDSKSDVERLIILAQKRGTPITVRLVKGAYWDYETVLAAQKGWPCPVFSRKEDTDANYEALSRRMLENWKHVRPAFGSHNIRSLSHAVALARELKVPERAYEVQMLFGMAEPARKAVRQLGPRVRVYAPVGELLPGMAYLVRRLLENTSNQSFLRHSFHDGVDVDALLRAPTAQKTDGENPGHGKNTFENLAMLDFALDGPRGEVAEALRKVRAEWLGKEHPVVIHGEKVVTGKWEASVNPTVPGEIIGKVASAGEAEAQKALSAARAGFERWREVDVAQRTAVLEKAAELMEKDRARLTALITLEVGKSWKEADADVCEAVDFCRYYAAEMKRLSVPQRMGYFPGELNHLFYEPRGVAVVIAPWNFPLAILCGMTTAALVTGNAVIMKPAEQSAVIGAHLFRILVEAGAPADVLHFVPGVGEVVGRALVASPEVDLIAFTGSMNVGLSILETAGKTLSGQRNVKHVVCEMGGKNAIIVDADADLDEAILGVVRSSFDYAGQKCSACSRVVVVEEAYDQFCARLQEAVKDLRVGDPTHVATNVPPVIDGEAQERLRKFVEKCKGELKVLVEQPVPEGLKGFFVPPTVFKDVPPDHALAQTELFGPVLAVVRAKDFEDALRIANSTPYALTGGVFSRSPGNLETARKRFRVGNLYLNRGITGALVGRQPFGGARMSGVGTKAGGPDYLHHFMVPRCTTENTMRRGFTPPDELEG